jgi:hypothetical protein
MQTGAKYFAYDFACKKVSGHTDTDYFPMLSAMHVQKQAGVEVGSSSESLAQLEEGE